jgi:LAO/AO transport system kinase
MSSKVKESLRKTLKERAPDGRISCKEARQVAEESGLSYSDVGAACNELGIRIHSCQLGCF